MYCEQWKWRTKLNTHVVLIFLILQNRECELTVNLWTDKMLRQESDGKWDALYVDLKTLISEENSKLNEKKLLLERREMLRRRKAELAKL